ncbi:hypothetical protein OJ996_20250 [Luteolibacter sp. GHJ8]|uniref:HEAT repeat protein n=1 Tax=Luteolibacter rhizosphaerae TaxID=2989719 RepID=A0ABT3G8V1_9BACT|nr:hypothetical protein [Luteolibacter rhizosphaerae]MCW1915931.1 hypothetical protein [Luteolibacter rhizosphaerae]
MKPASLILRYIFPALAGVAVGSLLVPGSPSSEDRAAASKASARGDREAALPPLADDFHTIELAALGGRTTEAKRKVAELLEEGATDQDIVTWLTPILLSDPGWMEHFVSMVPDGLRPLLVREAMKELSDHHLDAPWEVLKHSPSVMAMTRPPGGGLGQFLTYGAYQSPHAAAFLLDPANGYTAQEIRQALQSARYNPANARTMLEAWKSGRLPAGFEKDILPSAWLSLKHQAPDTAEALMKNLSPDQEAWFAIRQQDSADSSRYSEQLKHPESTRLEDFSETHIASYILELEESGRRVSLEQLGRLPENLRKQAAKDYLRYTYPYHSEGVMEDLRTLPSLGFSEKEQLQILERGIDGEWSDSGNFANAIELAGMIPDAGKREEKRRALLEDLAKYDPEAALEYAATLPDGEDRSRLEQQARENQR